METVDLFRHTETHAAEFAASDTFAAFAAALDGSKPGTGKLLQHIAVTYPGTWEATYATFKAHGFVGKALLMPHARKVSDLFDDVSLYAYTMGGRTRAETSYVRNGAGFVSHNRAKGFGYFGRLGATYQWAPEHLARGAKVRSVRGGEQWLTGATPNAAVIAAYGAPAGPEDWDISTFEAIRWSDGRILVTVNCHNGFGTRWLAVLDADQSALSMLDDHERGEIEAERARQAEAWGEATD